MRGVARYAWLLVLLAGCPQPVGTLQVYLPTDYEPGRAFDTIEVRVSRSDSDLTPRWQSP